MKGKSVRVDISAHIEFKDPSGKSLWQEYKYECNRAQASELQRHLEILQFASPYIKNNYTKITYKESIVEIRH